MMIMLTIMKTLKMNSRRIQLSNGLGENDDHVYSHLNEVQNECGVKKDKIGVLPHCVYTNPFSELH